MNTSGPSAQGHANARAARADAPPTANGNGAISNASPTTAGIGCSRARRGSDGVSTASSLHVTVANRVRLSLVAESVPCLNAGSTVYVQINRAFLCDLPVNWATRTKPPFGPHRHAAPDVPGCLGMEHMLHDFSSGVARLDLCLTRSQASAGFRRGLFADLKPKAAND
jgi:hypothetical protein